MPRSLRLSLLLVFAVSVALSYDFSTLKPQGHVSDFAGVVDQRIRAGLERYCKAVQSSTGAEIALVTLDTLHGEPIEDVVNLLYRNWGVGKAESDEGVMLLLVIGDRRSRLEVGYGLEPYLPDGYVGSLLRQMRPALQAGQYGEAMVVAAQTIGNRVAEQKGVTIQEAPPRQRGGSREKSMPLGSVIGGIVLVLWLLGSGGRRGRGGGMGGLLTGMFLGNMLGGGFHGRSSGGFGGFDSFDGFGGFGGGDSGGGGASGGW